MGDPVAEVQILRSLTGTPAQGAPQRRDAAEEVEEIAIEQFEGRALAKTLVIKDGLATVRIADALQVFGDQIERLIPRGVLPFAVLPDQGWITRSGL